MTAGIVSGNVEGRIAKGDGHLQVGDRRGLEVQLGRVRHGDLARRGVNGEPSVSVVRQAVAQRVAGIDVGRGGGRNNSADRSVLGDRAAGDRQIEWRLVHVRDVDRHLLLDRQPLGIGGDEEGPLALGAEIYGVSCAGCHGVLRKGATGKAPSTCMEECDVRPRCLSCITIRPSAEFTASVTFSPR